MQAHCEEAICLVPAVYVRVRGNVGQDGWVIVDDGESAHVVFTPRLSGTILTGNVDEGIAAASPIRI